VVVLVSLGLALISLALVPGMRRPLVVLCLAGLVCALVARTMTADGFLIASAGIVPMLVGLLVREIAGTFDLVGAPRRELRRARAAEQRAELRQRAARDRERQRRERERRRLAA
jgi:signal transduction histidine kinase